MSRTASKKNTRSQHEQPVYECTCCGDGYIDQPVGFYKVRSPLYKSNGFHITVCKQCIEELFHRYTTRFGSEELAIERICMMFNLPFRENGLAFSEKHASENSRIAQYFLYCLMGRSSESYDDYFSQAKLDESRIKTEQDLIEEGQADMTRRLLHFWGPGYTSEQYDFLQEEYEDWVSRYECKSKAQEMVYKNICLCQLNARIAMENGNTKAYKEAVDTMQSLMADANIKPSKAGDSVLGEKETFGTMIQKWEMTKPISEPAPEWRDVDGIRKYINVWFLGHLCKMFNIQSSFKDAYEKEIARYSVSPPKYDEDSEELGFDDLFGKTDGDADAET